MIPADTQHSNSTKRKQRLSSFTQSLISRQSSADDPGPDRTLVFLRVTVYVFAGVTALTAVSCVVSIIVLKNRIPVRGTCDGRRNQTEYCLPCRAITLSTVEENVFLGTLKRRGNASSGEETCCAGNSEQYAVFLTRFVEREIRLEKARGTLCRMTSEYNKKRQIYAHLLGMKQPPNAQHDDPALQWIHDRGMARTENIEYDKGYLVIPNQGLYFVYSQIYLTEYPDVTHAESKTNNSRSERMKNRITHKIVRTNILYGNRAEEVVLKNVQSKGWARKNGFLETTSYVGAAVFLRREDRIAVKVSNISLIHHYPRSTYFGIVHLS